MEPVVSRRRGPVAEITFPEGVGHKISKGTQLLAQLHLLNASDKDITDSVEITMHRSPATDLRPVGTYAFGTMSLELPAKQKSQVQATCALTQPIELIAAFPHMHLLGTSLKFEAGPSADAMQTLFTRDPYDFDDQHVELVNITLLPGDMTRVTCSYDNPQDQSITFGESTNNEMCFFVGFAADRSDVGGCVQGGGMGTAPGLQVPVDPAAGKCGDHQPNDRGVGISCSAGGGECPSGLMCTADFRAGSDGTCILVGCNGPDDCGGGSATCCAAPQGSVNICTAEACRTPSCIPLGQ